LVPVEAEEPQGTIKNFKFVATPPDNPNRTPAQAVYVQLLVDDIPPNLETIRVASATNTLSSDCRRPVSGGSSKSATPPRSSAAVSTRTHSDLDVACGLQFRERVHPILMPMWLMLTS